MSLAAHAAVHALMHVIFKQMAPNKSADPGNVCAGLLAAILRMCGLREESIGRDAIGKQELCHEPTTVLVSAVAGLVFANNGNSTT